MSKEKEKDVEGNLSDHTAYADHHGRRHPSIEDPVDLEKASVTQSDGRLSSEHDDSHRLDLHEKNSRGQPTDPYEESSRANGPLPPQVAPAAPSPAPAINPPPHPPQQPPVPLSDLDAGIVGWDSQDDPNLPLNFSSNRKWAIVGFVSAITFLTPFASTILAPAISQLHDELMTGDASDDLTLASMPISIYLLGYAVGPLFLSGLSEIYGRHIILCGANVFFCLSLIGNGLAPSLGALIAFRFLTGVGGSGCLTIGGGIIADMIPVHQRGKAITIWMLGPLIGPTIGPLIGAYVTQDIGWRWTVWIVLIAAVPTVCAIAVLSQETNPRVLIHRKTVRLRAELGRPELRSAYLDPAAPPQTAAAILARGLLRPVRLLFTSPLLFALSLYIAFCYGVLYLLFNTIPLVFQDTYGFDLGTTGLVYIPMGVGYAISMTLFSFLSDRTVMRLTAANGGKYEPEMRLVDCIYFACLLPITFFWYGWAAEARTHWIAPILALLPFGIGIVGVWQPIQAYLIDAFTEYAASALAAFTVFRSIVAAFLPLAGPRMYGALGLGWGNSLLGFIALAMIPVPLVICKFGGRLRARKLDV